MLLSGSDSPHLDAVGYLTSMPVDDDIYLTLVGDCTDADAEPKRILRADERGVVEVAVPLHSQQGTSLEGAMLRVGSKDGSLLKCALCSVHRHAQLALIGRKPAYEGRLEVRGLLVLTRFVEASDGSSRARMAATMTGLEADVSGMWHIHEGHSCNGGARRSYDVQAAPAFYPGTGWGYFTSRSPVRGYDRWTTASYRSDRNGVAHVDEIYVLDSPDSWTPLGSPPPTLDAHRGMDPPNSSLMAP